MDDLNKLLKEIMDEVEKTSEVKSKKLEKTSSNKINVFKTKVGDALYKAANLCKDIDINYTKLSYNDMQVFWENLK